MRTVITFGTFDILHVGHVRLLRRASELGGRLVVGVSTDALTEKKKARKPVYGQLHRREILEALRFVDEVFWEESLELKGAYIDEFGADVLAMGDDWRGRFDEFSNQCEVVYLPRTPSVSTTEVIEAIRA